MKRSKSESEPSTSTASEFRKQTSNTDMAHEKTQKREGKRPGRKPSKIDQKAKLERSRQSARECRARKKLRYQYLEELVTSREKAVFALRDELEMFRRWCSDLDLGIVPDGLLKQIAQEEMHGAMQRRSSPSSSDSTPVASPASAGEDLVMVCQSQQRTSPQSGFQQGTSPQPNFQQRPSPPQPGFQQRTSPQSGFQPGTSPQSNFQQRTSPQSGFQQRTSPQSTGFSQVQQQMYHTQPSGSFPHPCAEESTQQQQQQQQQEQSRRGMVRQLNVDVSQQQMLANMNKGSRSFEEASRCSSSSSSSLSSAQRADSVPNIAHATAADSTSQQHNVQQQMDCSSSPSPAAVAFQDFEGGVAPSSVTSPALSGRRLFSSSSSSSPHRGGGAFGNSSKDSGYYTAASQAHTHTPPRRRPHAMWIGQQAGGERDFPSASSAAPFPFIASSSSSGFTGSAPRSSSVASTPPAATATSASGAGYSREYEHVSGPSRLLPFQQRPRSSSDLSGSVAFMSSRHAASASSSTSSSSFLPSSSSSSPSSRPISRLALPPVTSSTVSSAAAQQVFVPSVMVTPPAAPTSTSSSSTSSSSTTRPVASNLLSSGDLSASISEPIPHWYSFLDDLENAVCSTSSSVTGQAAFGGQPAAFRGAGALSSTGSQQAAFSRAGALSSTGSQQAAFSRAGALSSTGSQQAAFRGAQAVFSGAGALSSTGFQRAASFSGAPAAFSGAPAAFSGAPAAFGGAGPLTSLSGAGSVPMQQGPPTTTTTTTSAVVPALSPDQSHPTQQQPGGNIPNIISDLLGNKYR